MVKYNELLTIFVMMPGVKQIIGDQSIPWPDPEAIERLFFERIALRLRQDLQREVNLHIEKDKHLADITHDSMFTETRQPPVYIVDLTGNNPSMYFELGICWALKNNMTILVSQDLSDVEFNAAYAHVIPYSNDPILLEQAIEDSVKMVKEGILDKEHINSSMILICNNGIKSNDEIKAYQKKIQLLEDKVKALTQSQDFLASARSANDPEQRMLLYQNAIYINPALKEAYLPLAEEQRKQSQYNDALATLRQAIVLFPTNAEFYREQGLIYSKSGRFEEAIESFRTAVTLNHKDDQAWGCLGGLLRRIGTKNMPYNWDALYEARDCYQKAIEVNDSNLYAQGNLARLNLLLSKIDTECLLLALDNYDTLGIMCRLNLKKYPNNYWTWFDWAECCLLSGKVDEGYRLYTRAIELVPLEYRKSELCTIVPPLTQLLLADVLLDDSVKGALQVLLEDLKLLISGQVPATNLRSICIPG